MIGRDPALVVTEADDRFHPPTNDDPAWIETLWFPFWVPEEGVSASVRVRISPNAGRLEGTLAGWRGDSQGLFGDRWSEAIVEPPDLVDFSTGPLRIERLEPLSRYRLRYESERARLDLVFEAIMPPNPVSPEESPGMFAGHFEQPGRVRGELRHGKRSHAIDCHAIRDRSWGPRHMPAELRLGNAHGTSASLAFFAYVNPTPDGVERITSGYLLVDGVAAAIVDGVRETTLRDGLAAAVRLEARDAAGRSLQVRGECVNTMASNAGNGVYAVLNLVRWSRLDGSDVCWGENHDVWSEQAWLAAGRRRL
ncbi:MAG: hypothetical protein KC616_07165 [Myxococcales bacterium]|nr:hypothetical protein [Myxococcales bacterium]